MRTMLLLLALSATGFATDPRIVLRGTFAKGADALPVGDWRNYGVEGATGKLDWEYDPVPELAFDSTGKPYLLTAEVGLLNVEKPLTSFRVEGKQLKTLEVAANDVILHGISPGKIRLVVRAENSSKRLATLLIDVGPRGPPAPVPVPVQPPGGQVSISFVIVRNDGPATQAFADNMAMPAWNRLREAGHNVVDVSLSDATNKNILNMTIPPGTKLPAVFPSYAGKDKRSHMIGQPLPLPTTEAAILKLGEIQP